MYPLYISKKVCDDTCEMLLIEEGNTSGETGEAQASHYIYVKDFNAFMCRITRYKARKYFCRYCLQHFGSETILEKHSEVCLEINGVQKIKLPGKGERVVFRNYNRQMPVPYVIYADLECILPKPREPRTNGKTEVYQEHIPCGFVYKVVCHYDSTKNRDLVCYRGESPVYKFLERMKGVYPYEYMDSFEKFHEKVLPSKEDFYSSLYGEGVSREDYSHVFGKYCYDLGDYHHLYLKTDVMLLVDVFENFRRVCLNYYKLDPCHYFSSSGLAWDAMLKMTGIKLELITDIDKYLMVEKGLRGGMSFIGHRYSKANHKYLEDYDSSKESNYIMYLDANNLYGWAMSQKLPYGGFEWSHDLKGYSDGSFVECDLEDPKDSDHDDYPLAPERVIVRDEWLSDYQREIKDKFNLGKDRMHKLVSTVLDIEKYVVHGRVLRLYEKLGLKIKKMRSFKF